MRVYVKPECKAYVMETEMVLLAGSVSGGHNDAEDDGGQTSGGHNDAEDDEGLNAKPGFNFD